MVLFDTGTQLACTLSYLLHGMTESPYYCSNIQMVPNFKLHFRPCIHHTDRIACIVDLWD
jgi:hypothetical protein